MDVQLTKNRELSQAERDQLEAMSAADVEKWMQGRSRELNELTGAVRAVNAQAHEILDRKNFAARRKELAERPADFPPAQGIGIARQ